MTKYIECEAAYRFTQDQLKKETGAYSKGWNNAMNVIKGALHSNDALPAADVVPVVRCKECEYWDATQEAPLSEGCFLCTLEGGYPKGDFYCALGERRMDGDGE